MPMTDRGRPGGGPADGFNGLRPEGMLRQVGAMSTLTAVLALAGATLIGVVVTVIMGTEPGNVLGGFVIVGSLVAVLGVRRRAIYLFFPVPALAFFVAAVATGVIHDRKMVSSTAGLAAAFPQWVAGIFWPAVVASILVLLVGAGRLLLKTPLVMGQSPLSASRTAAPGSARREPGSRAPVDPWSGSLIDDAAPRRGTGPTPRQATGPTPRQGTGPTPRQATGPTPRQATGPTPRQGTGPSPQQGSGPWRGPANGSRPSRAPRDRGNDRDPWGDPRLPPDRSQPTGPRPQANGRSASQAQPRPPRPGQSGPAPSFSPAPSSPRPPRRQPPDGWTQR